MRMIGITGGVGSGKSEVLSYLQEHYGGRAIEADRAGHLLMKKGGRCYRSIVELFGREVLDGEGELDRKKLGAIVFRHADLLEKLNRIVHPAVKNYILEETEKAREAGEKFVFLEAALLIEEKYDEICDELWYVYAEEGVRRERLKRSRQYSDEKIRDMMASQLTEEEFRRHCCFVLDNSGSFQATVQQLEQRMREYETV